MADRAAQRVVHHDVLAMTVFLPLGHLCPLDVLPLRLCGVAGDAHGGQIDERVGSTVHEGDGVVDLVGSRQELVTLRAPPPLPCGDHLFLRLGNAPGHRMVRIRYRYIFVTWQSTTLHPRPPQSTEESEGHAFATGRHQTIALGQRQRSTCYCRPLYVLQLAPTGSRPLPMVWRQN